MSTSDTSSTAEPTAAATSSPNQEQVMNTSNTNPVPSNGAPNASASSGTTNPAPASDKPASARSRGSAKAKKPRALNKDGKPRKEYTPFDPTDVLKEGAAAVGNAEGITDPVIINDVTQVRALMQPMRGLAGAIRSARSTAMAEQATWEGDDKKLEAAARPVFGVLRATDDGRVWLETCKASSYTDRVSNLSAGLASSGYVVPDQLLQPMAAALSVAEASKKRYDDAQAAKDKAIASYSTAKAELESATSALKGSLVRYKATQRAPSANVVQPVTPPAPPQLNGPSPGPGSKAASKSVKRNHANGVNGVGH
ncbi:MAG: hypothetical protein JST54_27475 [Deltaproteobacteria bacterium]|nr:hypothetical protein [Deltaproteobacteria bacterium]